MLQRSSSKTLGDNDRGDSSSSITKSVSTPVDMHSAARRKPRNCSRAKIPLNQSFAKSVESNEMSSQDLQNLSSQMLSALATLDGDASTGGLAQNDSFNAVNPPANSCRRRSHSINNADLPTNWKGAYKPKTAARRNSGADGLRKSAQMKLEAQKVLEGLHEELDDSDGDDDMLTLGLLGTLDEFPVAL